MKRNINEEMLSLYVCIVWFRCISVTAVFLFLWKRIGIDSNNDIEIGDFFNYKHFILNDSLGVESLIFEEVGVGSI